MNGLQMDPEFRDLIPALAAEERAGLERSILEEGVRDPVVVWGSTIVDGHNRYDICLGNNVDGEILECPAVYRDFESKQAAKLWIVENQLEHRRNLRDRQRIKLAETKRELIQAANPVGRPPKGEEETTQNFGEFSETRHDSETDSLIGEEAGVSREQVRKNSKVEEHGDQRILDRLDDGRFSTDQAYHAARVGKECGEETNSALWEQEDEDARVRFSVPQLKHLLKLAETNPDGTTADLVELAESGVAASVQKAHETRQREREKEERERRREELRAEREAAPMPERKYEIVYADPPWRYEHSKTESRAIENQYPTMGLDEIKAVKVPATENATLVMWATSPKLREALEVMEAWGFGYRTCMVWVKDKIGMGYYARQQHELVLIGRKGEPPVPEAENRPPSVFYSGRSQHSAKPESFYEVLETMYPRESKVELFARSARDGWDAWGNEALEAAS